MPGLPFGRRITRVLQHDATDCGAACLRSIAGYYGRRVPLSRIRQYASTDQQGTSVLGMLDAAARLGFVAKGVKGTYESLYCVPMPAVAHVIIRGTLQHFVVLQQVGRSHVRVMDPADGLIHRIPHAVFRQQWTGVLILLAPGEEFRPGNESSPPWIRFWSLVRPHRTAMAHALVASALCTLLGLAIAIYVQKLVDHVLVDGNRKLLDVLSGIMVAVIAVEVYLGGIRALLALRTGQLIDAGLVLGYYRHLLRLPQRFFDTMRVGEVLSRVNDAVKIRTFINDVSLDLIVNALVVAFSFLLMLAYHRRLALVVLAFVPVYAAIYALTNRANRRIERQVMESAAQLEAHLVETLSAAGTIKRFGIAEFAAQGTERRMVRLLRVVYRAGIVSIGSGSASDFASQLATVTLLWVGAGMVIEQSLSPGELMSCYALLGYLTGPVTRLIAANRTIQDALIGADRLFEILDLEQEPARATGACVPCPAADIHFERVSFGYGSRAEIFSDLRLTIPRCQVTGVVGESGSGKSTLAALLQGLYPVRAGRIRIGELDLRYVDGESLRKLVGVVPQQVDLFAGTVVENVALGDPEPDLQRVLAVCAELGMTGFVESLPEGLYTQLGENGATLSGGQRQRIAIARVLYREPEIVILDEATSSLDSGSEQQVQRAVRALRSRGTTVVVIAHRLSTVMHADKIVVLAGGGVAEEGTHEALMGRKGHYQALWQKQFPDAGRAGSFAGPPTGEHPGGTPA